MKNKEMVEKLIQFDPEADVIISDGYNCRFYSGDYSIDLFEGKIDIGIGGCEDEEK